MDATIAEFIVSPVIVGIMAVAANTISNSITRKQSEIDAAKREQRREDWEARVESKLDEHNNYGKKFGDIAVDIAEIKTEIRNIKESR